MSLKRQIILDTETTGIGHEQGHRIIEIGCVELLDRRHTSRHYHCYLNPKRPVDEGAFRVHGLSDAFLADKPLFSDVVNEFLEFIKGSELIIHNAPFDIGFLNAELGRLSKKSKIEDYCKITDSLDIARLKHPGQRNSLDALCKRYQVDATDRVFHGALLDAQLLADVYLAMTAGQKKLDFTEAAHLAGHYEKAPILTTTSPIILANSSEKDAHLQLLDIIKKKGAQLIWDQYENTLDE